MAKNSYSPSLIFITSLLILRSSLGFGQNQARADSLIRNLQIVQGDSARLQMYYDIARLHPDPELSVQYSDSLIALADKINELRFRAKGLHLKGVSYRLTGKLEESLNFLFQSASLATAINDSSELANSYTEIATTYGSSSDIQNSLTYNTKAIDLFRAIGDPFLRMALLNTGYDYYTVAEYDTALMYYDEAEELFQAANSKIGIAYTIGNRALVKWKTGDVQSAITDLEHAIDLLVPLGDTYGMADYHNQLGNIYYTQNDYRNAAYHLSKGVKMASSLDLREQVRDASKILSQIFHQQEVRDSAYVYLRQYIAMRDSIANEDIIKALANQRADYEINLKQIEVDLATQQKENRQVLAIAMAIIALLSGIFLVNYYRAYLKRKRLAVKLEALNATKDKFFSIVSHDLRGPISAFLGISGMIRGYLKQQSYQELTEMTDLIDNSANSISELLDNLLSWAVQQQGQVPYHPVPLDINQVLETTLGIFETSATAKGISLSNEIGRSLFVMADKDSTMTIFRNLVGNALKFTESGGKIWVDAETKNSLVHVKVHDTGIGMTEAQVEKLFSVKEKRSYGTEGETGLGLGLQLVNEFVALNKGSLTVESKIEEGSVFTVSLPVPDVKALQD